ncbi:MAG: hypothetical protein K2N73_00430 [Lachnospiraceae bacterium]|nr:hypothetical protein [Lachnospiraceae bacterium]
MKHGKKYGTGCGIHDKPDVCFETADFYVGFVGSKGRSFFVRIPVDKGLDADGGGLTVVGEWRCCISLLTPVMFYAGRGQG